MLPCLLREAKPWRTLLQLVLIAKRRLKLPRVLCEAMLPQRTLLQRRRPNALLRRLLRAWRALHPRLIIRRRRLIGDGPIGC